MTDCLILGFNDSNFVEHVDMVRSMGSDSGAFRDLRLAYVDHEGKPFRSMDILNELHDQGRASTHVFSNTDFLWPTITYLGTYLHRHGLTFDWVNQFQLERDLLSEKLRAGDVLSVAITTTLYVTVHPILEMVSFIREHSDTAKIIVGGPYVSNQAEMMSPDELEKLFRLIGADFYVVNREGEKALVDILRCLKSDGDCRSIPSVAARDGKGYRLNETESESNSLEGNMIDYGLFGPGHIGEFVSLRTAKSCPFSCAFCGFPQRAGKYTFLSVDLVEKELDALAEVGTISTLTFLDDTFNVPKPRFREILRLMIRKGYGFKWNSFYRSDHGNRETIELMAEAGCEGVFLGAESGSDEMLDRMNKRSRRHNYLEAIEQFRDVGISTYASLIVGFPGETLETFAESVSLVEEARPDYFRAQLWYCDPMTPIWNRREEEGVVGSAFNWSHKTMDCRTACDLVDRMFFTVENSIWMPQYGFEQWSTFYLQRHGMSEEQLKGFVRTFNEAVRRQVLDPTKKTIDPDVLATLTAYSQYDRPEGERPEASEPIQLHAGERFLEAERFWIDRLGEDAGRRHWPARAEADHEVAVARGTVAPELARSLSNRHGPALDAVLAGAFHVLLSRLGASPEAPILLLTETPEGERLVLLSERIEEDRSFGAYAAGLADHRREGLERADFSRFVLNDTSARHRHGTGEPVFEIGVRFGAGGSSFGDALGERYRDLTRDLGLLLAARPSDADGIDLELLSNRGWLTADELDDMVDHLLAILAEGAERPEVRLGDVALERSTVATELAEDAAEVFQF